MGKQTVGSQEWWPGSSLKATKEELVKEASGLDQNVNSAKG